MVILGLAVGKGSTRFDCWMLGIGAPNPLRLIVSPVLLTAVLCTAFGVALGRRQWRLAIAVAVCPPVAIVVAQVLKRVFDRDRGGALAYPSGHTTALVTVAGMVVLVAGGRWWALAVAAAVCLAGMVIVGMTFHYFTDTVGAMFLGTAAVCVAARLAGWAPGPDPART
jgi:membrane-associated phospholipid phosphatase